MIDVCVITDQFRFSRIKEEPPSTSVISISSVIIYTPKLCIFTTECGTECDYSILLQNIVVYYEKKYILPQNVIFYHNASNFTTVCNNSIDYTTTNYSILQQNIVVYHKKKQYLPQNVKFYNNVLFSPQSVVIPINYPTTNCNILLQNIVDYH